MILCSILIPTYNNAEKLKRCLNSLTRFDDGLFEIIVWNDGSNDHTSEIVQLFPNVSYYASQNFGVSATRNKLIDVAKGKYITFLDADDYWTDISLENMILAMDKYDYIRFGRKVLYNNYEVVESPKSSTFDNINVQQDYLNAYKKGYVKNVTSGFFLRDIVVRENIRFNEKIRFSEDTCFAIEYYSKIRNLCVFESVLYIYDKRNESSSTNENSIEMVDAIYNILETEKAHIMSKDNQTGIYLNKYKRLLNVLRMLRKKLSKSDQKQIIEKFFNYPSLHVRLTECISMNQLILAILIKYKLSGISRLLVLLI